MNKKIKVLLITLIFLLLISTTINISLISKINKKENYATITYTTISTKNDYIYTHFNIKTNKSITFHSSNFSILIDNMPMSANGIVKGYSGSIPIVGNDITLDESGIILVNFHYKYNEITNPIFLYNGQTIELGKELKIKI